MQFVAAVHDDSAVRRARNELRKIATRHTICDRALVTQVTNFNDTGRAMAGNSQSAKAPTNKGNERVAEILEAAKNIVVKKGLSALSYRNIAIGAGIAVGNVNYYYPAKEDLMVDLAGYIFDKWDVRFQKEAPAELKSNREIFLFSVKFMIEQNKRERTIRLLTEMWAMANHSKSVSTMLDAFYLRMRAWIAEMIHKAKPSLDEKQIAMRAALITAQIEGLMILIGPRRVAHEDLAGIEDEALRQIEKLAFA